MKTLFELPPKKPSKKKSKKKESVEKVEGLPKAAPAINRVIAENETGFLAELKDVATCPRCENTLLDLDRIEMKEGREQWLAVCGWGCSMRFWIDPVPGILKSTKEEKGVFRVNIGEFSGMTLSQVKESGNDWIIQAWAEGMADEETKQAALEFLKTS